MKYWVAIISFIAFSAPSLAEVSGATQSFIAKKQYEAAQLKKRSQGKIEYLRNNKDKSNIIGTNPHYSLEDLEPASGSDTAIPTNRDIVDQSPQKEEPEEQPQEVQKDLNNTQNNAKAVIPENNQPALPPTQLGN